MSVNQAPGASFRKLYEKTPFSKKILRKTRKSYEKKYDSLLTDLRKRMQKFVRKTYEIVTC